MEINDDLIRKILIKLKEVYPKKIRKMENILPEYTNQDEICQHLFHLEKLGYVEFVGLSSKDYELGCGDINITPPGIEYLKSLS